MVFSKLSSYISKQRSAENKSHGTEPSDEVNCSYVVPRFTSENPSVDEQMSWITQCELTLGFSLGIEKVFTDLAPELIGMNYDLFKAMVTACDKISDCCGKDKYDLIAQTILDGIPEVTRRNILKYLWDFYHESKKLTFTSRRLQDWILGRRIDDNAPQAQLMLILYYSMNQILDSYE